jgi:hypothetical protein
MSLSLSPTLGRLLAAAVHRKLFLTAGASVLTSYLSPSLSPPLTESSLSHSPGFAILLPLQAAESLQWSLW